MKELLFARHTHTPSLNRLETRGWQVQRKEVITRGLRLRAGNEQMFVQKYSNFR